MQVELAEERIFRIADRFSLEHAEGRAWAKRLEAFGALARVTGAIGVEDILGEVFSSFCIGK